MAPGPRVLPLIGNLHEVGIGKLAPAFPSQQPHRRFAALAKIHGDVMTIGMGSEPWLVLSSPEAVHEAFVSKGSDFAGRPMVTSMKISSGGKGASPVLRALPARCLRVACELPGPFHSTWPATRSVPLLLVATHQASHAEYQQRSCLSFAALLSVSSSQKIGCVKRMDPLRKRPACSPTISSVVATRISGRVSGIA